jgi:hypothetical protein
MLAEGRDPLGANIRTTSTFIRFSLNFLIPPGAGR